VVLAKNSGQASCSASQPPPEDIAVRPPAISDVNSAYCVAAAPGRHRPDRKATNAADARPPAKASVPIAIARNAKSRPITASAVNIRFVSACSTPPHASARTTPARATTKPPANTPARFATTPKRLLALAISTPLNPRST
jgi:hypothetical protein